MRITFLTALADLSGGSLVIAQHARRLRARGHEVTIVSRWPRRLSWRERIRELVRGNGWHTHEEPLASHYDGLDLPVVRLPAGAVPTGSDLPDADVLVATWFETVAWALAVPRTKGAVVHFVQGYEAFGPFTKEAVDAALRQPVPKFTVSRWLTDIVTRLGARDVTTIPNSIDFARFTLPARERQARPTVGFVYSHEAFKGGDVLAAAIARLRTQFRDLAVVGFGLRAPLSEHAGLRDATFTVQPAQSRIPALYASADVWLTASRLEGFGLPLLEALACGTPVVSTRVGAAEDLITPGANGALVAIDDAEALAREAAAILEWPSQRWSAASAQAASRAREWSWDAANARFEAEASRIARLSATPPA